MNKWRIYGIVLSGISLLASIFGSLAEGKADDEEFEDRVESYMKERKLLESKEE